MQIQGPIDLTGFTQENYQINPDVIEILRRINTKFEDFDWIKQQLKYNNNKHIKNSVLYKERTTSLHFTIEDKNIVYKNIVVRKKFMSKPYTQYTFFDYGSLLIAQKLLKHAGWGDARFSVYEWTLTFPKSFAEQYYKKEYSIEQVFNEIKALKI